VSVVLGVVLCGCSPKRSSGESGLNPAAPNLPAAPTEPVTQEALPPSGPGSGASLATPPGAGAAKIGLLLPLTVNGAPSALGASLRNAADLAVAEAKDANVALVVEDDQSTPDGAANAARTALGQGVRLILGPVLAADVRAAAAPARAAGVPVVAFSTDPSVASKGVYLLSFLVETYVDRVLRYAVSNGRKSFAALIPDTDYGRAAEAEFLQEAARLGVTIREDERFEPGQSDAAVRKIAADLPAIDAIFIPEQAAATPAIARNLSAAGVDARKTLIMGTGLWNDARVLSLPSLQGAVFASPDPAGFAAFAANYRARFNADPPRLASLGHDAAALALALAKTEGTNAFTDADLTNPSGFRGVDGIFRFLANGTNQRGLTVDEIRSGSAAMVSPAPHSFGAAPVADGQD
jgi:ABC-type branched-subunit amino acid transport system substrate-binding protein